MQPAQLTPATFAAYPPQARALATAQLPLLRELPLVLIPILLRELITYDWKLPAERRELEKQFTFLGHLSPAERTSTLAGFQALTPSPEIAAVDWVNNPSAFMEQLTAWLWHTGNMDRFRATADTYGTAINQALPDTPPAIPRLGIVIIGAGSQPGPALFRKLRPNGLRLTHVIPTDGVQILLAEAARRASTTKPADFEHWYIEGATPTPLTPQITHVSYAALAPARARLLEHMHQSIDSGHMGPEELRSLLARMAPSDIGLPDTGADAVLSRFQLSLLTEGSGTQIFATTFVQWAARECIRRAQPQTLLVRYAPRQQAQTMNAMLSGATPTGTDPAASLVDADIGAYYTWLNLRRLSGGDQLRFLAWFEDHREAVVIAPDLPRGTTSDSPMTLPQILKLLSA